MLIKKSDGSKVVVDEKKTAGPAHVGEEVTIEETGEKGTVVGKGTKRLMETMAKEMGETKGKGGKKEKKNPLKVFLKLLPFLSSNPKN